MEHAQKYTLYEGHSEIFEMLADENIQDKNNGLILKYKVLQHGR